MLRPVILLSGCDEKLQSSPSSSRGAVDVPVDWAFLTRTGESVSDDEDKLISYVVLPGMVVIACWLMGDECCKS